MVVVCVDLDVALSQNQPEMMNHYWNWQGAGGLVVVVAVRVNLNVAQ